MSKVFNWFFERLLKSMQGREDYCFENLKNYKEEEHEGILYIQARENYYDWLLVRISIAFMIKKLKESPEEVEKFIIENVGARFKEVK